MEGYVFFLQRNKLRVVLKSSWIYDPSASYVLALATNPRAAGVQMQTGHREINGHSWSDFPNIYEKEKKYI